MEKSEIELCFRKLHDFTRQRRLRWESLFFDADRHNNKRITDHAFSRALHASKVPFSNNEIQMLIDAFRCSKDPSKVNYQAFADKVNLVFTEKGLERNPLKTPAPTLPNENLHYVDSAHELSREEEEDLAHILGRIGHYAESAGVILGFFFHDFDRHLNGFVSQEQFRRGIKMLFQRESLQDEDVQLLIKAFVDKRGDVNYKRFCNDAREAAASRRDSYSGRDFEYNYGDMEIPERREESIEELVKKMQYVAYVEGLRLQDFFADWDRLRQGFIKRAQFCTVVTAIFGKSVPLSEDQLEALANLYPHKVEPNAIDYGSFIDAIEVEKAELRTLTQIPTQKVQQRAKPQRDDSVQVSAKVVPVLSRVAAKVQTRRINMKPLFEDFDRFNRGYLSRFQFARVLAQELTCLSLTEDDMNALCDTFTVADKGVNYFSFIKYVEAKKSTLNASGTTEEPSPALELTTTTMGTPSAKKSPSKEDVLRKLRIASSVHAIRFREFLKDDDLLRKGLLSVDKLVRGLSRTRIRCTPEEIDVLVKDYIKVSGSSPSHQLIDWLSLVRDIELAEVAANLEKEPENLSKIVRLERRARDPVKNLTVEEEEIVRAQLQRIGNFVATNRILIAPTFYSYDKQNTGRLQKSIFRRAFGSLKLKVCDTFTEEDYDRVSAFFTDEACSFDADIINYRDFLKHVQAAAQGGPSKHGESSKLPALSPMKKGDRGRKGKVDIESILLKIKEVCWSKRIRINEFLCDYDRLRKGTLPCGKFESALVMCGLTDLSSEEIKCLTHYFRSLQDPARVAYKDFVYMIDGGNEQLEKDPSSAMAAKVIERDFRLCELNDEELQEVLHPMRIAIKLRSVSLMDAFKLYDKQNMKAVTLSRFMAVLKSHDMLFKDYSYTANILHQAFPSRHPEKVNYQSFLRALEN